MVRSLRVCAFLVSAADLYHRQIAAGCGHGDFCPTDPDTRGQMAAFLVDTFGLALDGP